MTPVPMLAARQRSGPPTLVTFLPAFWLLVPGAISLAGVTACLGKDRVEGTTSLVSAGSTMIAITHSASCSVPPPAPSPASLQA